MIKDKRMHTIDNSELNEEDFKIDNFTYQRDLTSKLDKISKDFDQDIINEIVLWKVSRYASVSKNTLELLNRIDPQSDEIDESLTHDILIALLNTKGVRLPMASTFLRFKNPNVYQIIDQRVYRFLYGKIVKYPNDINEICKLYLDYLSVLKSKCKQYSVQFKYSDRIIYMADKRLNKKSKLDNY